MIKEMDNHYGVCCDFCGQDLSDKEIGGTLVTDTPSEAHELAKLFEWFSDNEGHKHYCTLCVPSVQSIKDSWLTKWFKLLVPFCNTESAILTSTFGIVFIVAMMHASLIVAGVAALGYALSVRHHYIMHQRNELLSVVITMLEHDHEGEKEE